MPGVEVKCPHCGYKAEWTKIGSSSGDFVYPEDIYQICPIIRDRLNRREKTGVKALDCPHYYQEAAAAVAAIGKSLS